jgi:hypothetical protein
VRTIEVTLTNGSLKHTIRRELTGPGISSEDVDHLVEGIAKSSNLCGYDCDGCHPEEDDE